MVDLALRGNPTMLIWTSKNMLGWSDRQELTGANRGPLQVEQFDASKLTDAQLEQARLLIESATPTPDSVTTASTQPQVDHVTIE